MASSRNVAMPVQIQNQMAINVYPSWVFLPVLALLASRSFNNPISVNAVRVYDENKLTQLRDGVKSVFYHAYDSYLTYAYPLDELRPLSCDGMDTWGSYSLTLIDTLDTLVVMGNYSEFRRVAKLIIDTAHFDLNINVSVFETNIRIIGGLLSAHLLSQKAGMELEEGWPCNGALLRLAEKVAKKLIPAFDTPTGMPYGTVNLRYGVPPDETPVTCTAGVGTFIVEFGTLSRLTGDPLYEKVALKALYSLYSRKSPIDLVGNHIDTSSGKWTAIDAGIGAGVDSYFEYLVKGSILFQKPELMNMFKVLFKGIQKHLGRGGWYVWASMNQGLVSTTTFQSLEAFWPGLLSLVGEFKAATSSLKNYHKILKQYGGLPELYNIMEGKASPQREGYPLRPELIESTMYIYRATKNSYFLEIGEDLLYSIQKNARTDCGFATIRDLTTLTLEDRMESFFIAETLKYLYLLFDPNNFLHGEGSDYELVNGPSGKCIIYAGGWQFNTEAHPIDPSAFNCCTGPSTQDLHEEIKNIDEFDFVDQDTFELPLIRRKAEETKSEVEKTEPAKPVEILNFSSLAAEDASFSCATTNPLLMSTPNNVCLPTTISNGKETTIYLLSHLVEKMKGSIADPLIEDAGKNFIVIPKDSELINFVVKYLVAVEEDSNEIETKGKEAVEVVKALKELKTLQLLNHEIDNYLKLMKAGLVSEPNRSSASKIQFVQDASSAKSVNSKNVPDKNYDAKVKSNPEQGSGQSGVIKKNSSPNRGSANNFVITSYRSDNTVSSSENKKSPKPPDMEELFTSKGHSLSFYFSLLWLKTFPSLIKHLIPSESFDLRAFHARFKKDFSDDQLMRDFNISMESLKDFSPMKCSTTRISDRFLFF